MRRRDEPEVEYFATPEDDLHSGPFWTRKRILLAIVLIIILVSLLASELAPLIQLLTAPVPTALPSDLPRV